MLKKSVSNNDGISADVYFLLPYAVGNFLRDVRKF